MGKIFDYLFNICSLKEKKIKCIFGQLSLKLIDLTPHYLKIAAVCL